MSTVWRNSETMPRKRHLKLTSKNASRITVEKERTESAILW